MREVRSFIATGVLGLLVASCSDEPVTPTPPKPLSTTLAATTSSTRFLTADHMLASIEMQISGEPFAELLGRDVGGYDRFSAQTDNYIDPATGMLGSDPLGFSLAIESYE
ncbi:MAG: hypothetical protein ABI193_12545, partial [Minicystis sp.]